MTILHLMAGLGETSGVANVARRFARAQSARGDKARLLAPAFKWNPAYFDFAFAVHAWRQAHDADEIWVHCSWTFPVWFGAWIAKRLGKRKRLVVVPEASFDPQRLHNASGWKKRLVAPLDRWVLRQADEVVALCSDEVGWVRAFEPTAHVRFVRVPTFCANVSVRGWVSETLCRAKRPLHVLFLGRVTDPLKGVRFLTEAVATLNGASPHPVEQENRAIDLRLASNVVGAEKEAVWAWCDVLCLPTLSDNFGLVVAEALERGKPVITTDGAPAWKDEPRTDAQGHTRLVYLEGYRNGTDAQRVELLKGALRQFSREPCKVRRGSRAAKRGGHEVMKISIVTAVWNRAETIRSALESVARQKTDGFDLEHVIVDGGSTDGTVEVIRTYADGVRRAEAERRDGESAGRFTVRWVSEKDRGLYDAINKGIRMATGDVVGLVHSDDVLAADDTLARIAQAFRAEVDATYADIRFVHGGRTVDEIRQRPAARYCTGRFFRRWMFRFATFPAHPGTFVRRACFERYGLYSLDYPICADFELMLRLFVTHRIRARYLPICTHVMRTGGLSTGGFRSNVAINRQDLRALRANGVWSCLPLIYLKYVFKVWGFVFRRRPPSTGVFT